MSDIDSWGNLILARKQVKKIRPGSISLKEYCLTDTKDEVENERRKRLLEEYSDKNEISVNEITRATGRKVLWKCSICGKMWKESTAHRTREKSNCPYCSGRRVSELNSLLTYINNNGAYGAKLKKEYSPKNKLGLDEISFASHKKVLWKCSICKKEWRAIVKHRTREKSGCNYCNKKSTSFPEQLIFYILTRELPNYEVFNRDKSEGREIDVYIPALKFGIEYDGWNWHKDKQEEDNKKHQFFKKRGLDIIRIIGKENDKLLGVKCNLEYNVTNDSELLRIREYIKKYLSEHYNIEIDISMTGEEIQECKRQARKEIENTLGGFDLEELDILEDEIEEEYLPSYL